LIVDADGGAGANSFLSAVFVQKSCPEWEGKRMVTTLTIAPISEAPVRQGEEDLRPVLVAPGLYSEWTLACWGGRDWYDQHSGRVLKPAVYCLLPQLASITTS